MNTQRAEVFSSVLLVDEEIKSDSGFSEDQLSAGCRSVYP